MYDIVIIGGGPAGLTAAIYARRSNKSVMILERGAFGGQMTFSPKIENYPGFESISGNDLADKMVEQALSLGADVELENVLSITDNGDKKIVTTEDNTYEAKSVIIACGAKHRRLKIENEEKFIGDGISFCAVCDGAFYTDKTVALIGGGNSALQEAVLLSDVCKKVYIVQNLAFLTGEDRLQEILKSKENVEIICSSVVHQIPDGEELKSIVIQNTDNLSLRTLEIDGMFIAIGLEPENSSFSNVCDLDSVGYIDSSETCNTRTNGIFVAGDCRSKCVRQISTAISDGATAAISACRFIDGY